MSDRALSEPAYVLHRRPYRETSLIVDLLTLNHGRMSVVARGATRGNSQLKANLQPFVPLHVAWQGRQELKTLLSAEVAGPPRALHDTRLFSAFYLNELLQKLLPAHDAHLKLFATYVSSLDALASSVDIEATLRHFEWVLLDALGYGLDWETTSDGDVLLPEAWYAVRPDAGLQRVAAGVANAVLGSHLGAISQRDFSCLEIRRTAKQVMRYLIDHLLQGRPLESRKLFRSLSRPQRSDNEKDS